MFSSFNNLRKSGFNEIRKSAKAQKRKIGKHYKRKSGGITTTAMKSKRLRLMGVHFRPLKACLCCLLWLSFVVQPYSRLPHGNEHQQVAF